MEHDPAVDPVLCDPYREPDRHWSLDEFGRALPGEPRPGRRPPLTPRFVPDDTKTPGVQQEWDFETSELNQTVKAIREKVGDWRRAGYPKATGVTRQLLFHWSDEQQCRLRPFFAQREAIETLIWLREVATRSTRERRLIEDASREMNDGIVRYAAKMATGSGKTAVMGMLIAWQTLNAIRTTRTRNLRHGQRFAVLAPGLTVRERLEVLQPSRPGNIYDEMGLVPRKLRAGLSQARVKIVNFQAFTRRDLLGGGKTTRDVLRVDTEHGREDPRAAAERVLRELTRGRRGAYGDVVVINDEAHHCWLPSDRTTQTKKDTNPAAVWFNAVRALRDAGHLGRVTPARGQESVVYDFSATPMWIGARRSRPRLFEWVVSDFPLMDAIESGLVKVPRVPVDVDTHGEKTVWRNLYKNTPRKTLDPKGSPPEPLAGAARALYDDYEQTHRRWEQAGMDTPPVMIVVANNIRNAERLYNWIAGHRPNGGPGMQGVFPLLSNIDPGGEWYHHPRTLLVHSQIDEGRDELTQAVGALAKRQVVRYAETLPDRQLGQRLKSMKAGEALRLMMNTVGKRGQPGEQVRCVVSVEMLTEGWDVRTVTHVLGFRRFGTQLLCEQVTGRALRRSSYDSFRQVNGRRLLSAEYADVVGVPFEFMPSGGTSEPKPPKRVRVVESVPGREGYRIGFPLVEEYMRILPDRRVRLDPTMVKRYTAGTEDIPTMVIVQGVSGEEKWMAAEALSRDRVRVELAAEMVRRFAARPENGGRAGNARLFRDLYRATGDWLSHPNVECADPVVLLADDQRQQIIDQILDACQPDGASPGGWAARLAHPPVITTADIRFETALENLVETTRSELNLAACHSRLEAQCAQLLDDHPKVDAWARNHLLGWSVPYHHEGIWRPYFPDFVARLVNGTHLIVECKGRPDDKSETTKRYVTERWIPAVAGTVSLPDRRWGFVELTDPQTMNAVLDRTIDQLTNTERARAYA